MSTTTPEFNWSDVQRSPRRIERALTKHTSVRLKRRNDTALVLSKVERVGSELVDVLAQVFTALAGDGAGADLIARSSLHAWPWLIFMSEKDRQLFLEEFTTTVAGCAAVDEYRPLAILLTQWRNTATAIAAGVDLKTPVTDGAGDVPRPSVRRKRGRKK